LDDDRVLDEDGIGTVISRRHLDGLPARAAESFGIRKPLGERAIEVHRLLVDVCNEAVGEQ
jgi:hypothetical protein